MERAGIKIPSRFQTMKLTKKGICKDLPESPYTFTTDHGYTFHFSSSFYQNKFIENFVDHRLKMSTSLSDRFNIEIRCTVLSDFVLYKKIEKRGFFVKSHEGITLCQRNQIVYVGGKMTKRNYQERSATITPK